MPEYKKLTHATADVDSTITEVTNAKTGSDNVIYQTLKARLDTENSNLNKTVDSISEVTQNRFIPENITLGINQIGQANADRALTAAYQRTGTALTISAKRIPSNIKYMVIGYSDAEYGDAVAISADWIDDATYVTTNTTKEYLRVVFTTKNGNAITSQDFVGLEMQIENGSAATNYVPHIIAYDYVARNMQQAAGSAPVHVKVLTYNIGAYTYGSAGTIDESVVVPQCRAFFTDEDCDIVALCENKTSLDTHTSDEAIYDYLYPYKINAINTTAIKSRFILTNTGSGTFTGDTQRPYVYGTVYINGKEIFLMCVHLSPSSSETRAAEYAELFEILENHETFIVFGDFNADSATAQNEYNLILAQGYHVANGGYLGLINTYGTTTEYLDNIFTSSDITIAKTYVPNVYDKMPSDHLPLVCDLVIYP